MGARGGEVMPRGVGGAGGARGPSPRSSSPAYSSPSTVMPPTPRSPPGGT